MKDLGDKFPEDDKKKVEEALSQAKESLKSSEVSDLKKAEETLTAASHKLAEQMYKNAGAAKGSQGTDGQNATNGGASGQPKEDVVDAEYKVEDDK